MHIFNGTNLSQRGRKVGATLLASASMAGILFTAAPAMAQSSETNLDNDTVVVTARKREESIQDVPLSISAFTGEDIRRKGITELEDVALLTPGLTFEDFSSGGFGTPIIRGAAQFDLTSLEQNVATFIDGVYVPRSYSVDVGTDSLERIEVVKGPQSALYGANAFTGAINYITRKADLDQSYGDVQVTIGNNERFDISGSYSLPIIEGVLAVKLDGKHSEFDGDWDNDHPLANSFDGRGTEGNLGGFDDQSYGASVIFQPTDRVHIDLGYRNIQKETESRAQTRLERSAGDLNCGAQVPLFPSPFAPLVSTAFCGELPDTPLVPGTDTEAGFVVDPRAFAETETELFRGKVSVDVTEKSSLSYEFANISADTFAPGNSDRNALVGTFDTFGTATQGNAFTVFPAGGFDYDSHEIRLDYTTDSGIYAMIGGFISDGEDLDTGQAGLFAPLFVPSAPGTAPTSLAPIQESDLLNPGNNLIETETRAVFAQIDIPLLNDRLNLSAEGRYVTEDITGSDPTGEFVFEDDYFVPRVSLDYKLGEDNLLFASIARGVKSGGVNGTVLSTPPSFFPVFIPGTPLPLADEDRFFDPDTNVTYEIGTKNTFLDGRAQLNIAAYYIDWEDLQISVAAEGAAVNTATITGNIGSATSKGIELDGSFDVTDNFTLNGGLALNDATYDDDVISQRIVRAGICDDVVCNSNGDIGGNELPRSSDFQWNIGAEYGGEFGTDYGYFLRADLVGQSEQFVGELNLATIPDRALLNFRAGVNKGDFSLDFWVSNVTDEEYVSNAFYIPNPFFVSYVPTFGNRRRAGVTLGYAFN